MDRRKLSLLMSVVYFTAAFNLSSCDRGLVPTGYGNTLSKVTAALESDLWIGIAYGNGTVYVIPSLSRTAFKVFEIIPYISTSVLPGTYATSTGLRSFPNPTAICYNPTLNALMVLNKITSEPVHSDDPAPLQMIMLGAGQVGNVLKFAPFSSLLLDGKGLCYSSKIRTIYTLTPEGSCKVVANVQGANATCFSDSAQLTDLTAITHDDAFGGVFVANSEKVFQLEGNNQVKVLVSDSSILNRVVDMSFSESLALLFVLNQKPGNVVIVPFMNTASLPIRVELTKSSAITELETDAIGCIIGEQADEYQLFTLTLSGSLIDLDLKCSVNASGSGTSSSSSNDQTVVRDVSLVVIFVFFVPLCVILLLWHRGYFRSKDISAMRRPLLEHMADLQEHGSGSRKAAPAFIHLQEMQALGQTASSDPWGDGGKGRSSKKDTYLKQMIDLWDQPIPLLDHTQITLSEIIASGTFGMVWKGTFSGGAVAVKVLFADMVFGDFIAEDKGPFGGSFKGSQSQRAGSDRKSPMQKREEERQKKALKAFNEFQKEATLLSRLRHPNIVQLFGVSVVLGDANLAMRSTAAAVEVGDGDNTLGSRANAGDYNAYDGYDTGNSQGAKSGESEDEDAGQGRGQQRVSLYLVQEMAQCALSEVELGVEAFDSGLLFKLVLQVARGMRYLHEQEPMILHRDLKMKNVLLSYSMDAKLCDFGISCIGGGKDQQYSMTGLVGTPNYMAPELMADRADVDYAHSGAIDVYSFAILTWHMWTQQEPFEEYVIQGISPFRLMQDVVAGKRPPLDFDSRVPRRLEDEEEAIISHEQLNYQMLGPMPAELAGLLSRCWAASPSERPTFAIIDHLLTDSPTGLGLKPSAL